MNPMHRKPEHWSVHARGPDVARLDIPADAQRERSFEIYCRLVAAAQSGRADATHGMRLLVNGALEWARTAATPEQGSDSLELRLRRTVPIGQSLRLVATCELRGASRLTLSITADEE